MLHSTLVVINAKSLVFDMCFVKFAQNPNFRKNVAEKLMNVQFMSFKSLTYTVICILLGQMTSWN